MKHKILPVIVFLAFLCWLGDLFAGEFKVIRVYDGDTVKAAGCDIEIKIRLVGIDAPETAQKKRYAGQPFADKSKKFLAKMVLKKKVNVIGLGTDSYGRVLGVLFVNGNNVNLEMVKAGYAEVYRGQPPRGFDTRPYIKAETEAKAKKRKIWSLGKKYISPSVWREKFRQ